MSKTQIGRFLLVSGLLCWAALMVYIVINFSSGGSKPGVPLIVATVGCWAVFFVGKTMLKHPGSHAQ